VKAKRAFPYSSRIFFKKDEKSEEMNKEKSEEIKKYNTN
jgi:hypothetical protein